MKTKTFKIKTYAAVGDVDEYLDDETPFGLFDLTSLAHDLETLGEDTLEAARASAAETPYGDPDANALLEITVTITVAPAETS